MFLPPYQCGNKADVYSQYVGMRADILYAKRNGVDAYAFDKQRFARDTIVPGRRSILFTKRYLTCFQALKVDEHPYTKAANYYVYYNGPCVQPTRADLAKLENAERHFQLKLKTHAAVPADRDLRGALRLRFYFRLLDTAVMWAVRRIELCASLF